MNVKTVQIFVACKRFVYIISHFHGLFLFGFYIKYRLYVIVDDLQVVEIRLNYKYSNYTIAMFIMLLSVGFMFSLIIMVFIIFKSFFFSVAYKLRSCSRCGCCNLRPVLFYVDLNATRLK